VKMSNFIAIAAVLNVLTFSGAATQALPEPRIISPVDGEIFKTGSITFKWSDVKGNVSYYFINIKGPGMRTTGNYTTNTTSVSTSIPVPGPNIKNEYIWTVFAIDVNGQKGNKSEAKFYTTRDFLSSPTLTYPAEGDLFESGNNITIKWSEIQGAANYRIKINGPGFNNDLSSSDTSFSISISLQAPSLKHEYKWRIHAVDSDGYFGPTTEAKFYIKRDPLPAPKIISPLDGAVLKSADVSMKWSEVSGTMKYEIYVEDPSGNVWGSPFFAYSGSLNLKLKKRVGKTEYHWRVTALDSGKFYGQSVNATFFIE